MFKLKKIFIPIVSIIFLSFFTVWFYTGNEKKLQKDVYVQPYYIALGDSLVAGMGVPPHMGYTDTYFNYLLNKDSKTKYLNLGHGGDTTNDLLNSINSNQVELSKATLITIHIGINDIFERIRTLDTELPPSEIKSTYDVITNNLQIISSKLKQLSPNAKIILLNYYNPFPEDPWFNSHIKNLNTIIKNKAESNAFLYVDTYALFENTGLKYLMKNNYQQDPIHPNIEGYKEIANLIITKNR